MNEWFPISSVSKNVNIPPETVRRYARQYGNYLVIKRGEKKAYLIHESSFGIIKKIRYLLEQGHQHEQVKSILDSTEGFEVKKNIEETRDHLIDNPQLYKEMMKEMQILVEQNKRLVELVNRIHDRMNRYEELFLQQQAFSYEHIHEQDTEQRDNQTKHDAYLMKAMNELHERRKEVASTKEKKGLFNKLLKK